MTTTKVQVTLEDWRKYKEYPMFSNRSAYFKVLTVKNSTTYVVNEWIEQIKVDSMINCGIDVILKPPKDMD